MMSRGKQYIHENYNCMSSIYIQMSDNNTKKQKKESQHHNNKSHLS